MFQGADKSRMKWFKPDWKVNPIIPEIHEAAERQWVSENVPKGGIFIDVGADVGSWAINLAEHFDKVYAIEPSVDDFRVLCHNIDLNDLNVKVLACQWAADSMNGKLVLSSRSVDSVPNWSISYTVDSAWDRWELVEARPLDSLNVSPKLIKIDVEGWGGSVMDGAVETLKKTDYLVFELHNDKEQSYLETLLQGEWEMLHQSGGIRFLRRILK